MCFAIKQKIGLILKKINLLKNNFICTEFSFPHSEVSGIPTLPSGICFSDKIPTRKKQSEKNGINGIEFNVLSWFFHVTLEFLISYGKTNWTSIHFNALLPTIVVLESFQCKTVGAPCGGRKLLNPVNHVSTIENETGKPGNRETPWKTRSV